MQSSPTRIELVGKTLALMWPDGREQYFEPSFLRRHSPSAEQTGEADLFGVVSGGNPDGAEIEATGNQREATVSEPKSR